MSRLVVVSNRVAPIQEGEATAGGLAAGVLDALRQKGGLWFGWSGEVTDASVPQPERKVGPITLFTVDLSRRDYDDFYRGFANGTLWPVLHYQIGLGRFEWTEFEGYRRVNDLFARALATMVEPDDVIWAHDYHLLCFADSLRELGIHNRVGLFIHTPFPAPGVFMTIPSHSELIRSMCGYDLIGFQTEVDRTAFVDYLLRQAGADVLDRGAVHVFGRTVRTGVYPIGVHVDEVRAQAETPINRRQATRMRAFLMERLILSVDRLDYSKGLRQRFNAFERFLAEYPAQHGLVTFMQIAPPSRSDIETYQRIRLELEGEAGRINGRFAEVDWVPLRYLNRSFARNVLMPLYAEAQTCLVTPLRDGMNLVAKEYVAAQDPDEPGVLILSEFAGAARELDAALLVNPYDEAGMARAMDRALSMPVEERRERHQAMIQVMRANSLERWRDRFEADLRAG
ncbi:alpha,alpha-trehalose-phosphate synthase (UDP-forming) [Rhodopila sp.]|jgi:trehalose 6-phosphate synthase|uniref:alpha,alpha-trehalose-phosphate synthase (UDP-forming) n=1 Tax=Rhodopila sp. TaxID=2480087 RepID=UPI002BCD6203|nr:alpha,alpha-trehalose-phosphate synthase (UDP-forming) [Rhodopila sp.]HVZ06682.1 alpha,alpha-trehalose-phosphate synthase (UDP-forming) [Rhodopila sp.]